MAEDDRPEPRDAIYAMFIPPEWAEHHIRATDTPSQQLAQEAQKAEVSQCRRDNGSVCDPPIYVGFCPQNIPVIMSQESHYWNVFLIGIHFPHPPKYGSYWS